METELRKVNLHEQSFNTSKDNVAKAAEVGSTARLTRLNFIALKCCL